MALELAEIHMSECWINLNATLTKTTKYTKILQLQPSVHTTFAEKLFNEPHQVAKG